MYPRLVPSGRLLLLLLLTDGAFILLHVVARLEPSAIDSSQALLNCERGYAEVFQYVKWLWLALLFCMYSWERQKAVYVAWFALFAYLFVDDSMELHEEGGLWLSEALGFQGLGLIRARDVGELIFSLATGGLLVSLVAVATYREGVAERGLSLLLGGFLLALGCCGIVADMLHMLVPARTALGLLMEIVEDGGELVVASSTLWVVYELDAVMAKASAKIGRHSWAERFTPV